MSDTPRAFIPLGIAVLTISDTRSLDDDKSGATLVERLTGAGHRLAARALVTDDIEAIRAQVKAWIADPEGGIGSVRSEILNRLWALFRDHGIEVPFPQRDIRVKEWPPGQGDTGGPPP